VSVLVDSNVLIFSIQKGHPWHEDSIAAIESLLVKNETLYMLPQNVAEFWNVCTRPCERNGLGLSPEETQLRIKHLEDLIAILHDTPEAYLRWRRLLVAHSVKGIQVHDARIAAAMQTHSIRTLLTYNPRDFNRYGDIEPLLPASVK
jgi:predicted nucleic acid-binding protein